jgi:hypothetical protein
LSTGVEASYHLSKLILEFPKELPTTSYTSTVSMRNFLMCAHSIIDILGETNLVTGDQNRHRYMFLPFALVLCTIEKRVLPGCDEAEVKHTPGKQQQNRQAKEGFLVLTGARRGTST